MDNRGRDLERITLKREKKEATSGEIVVTSDKEKKGKIPVVIPYIRTSQNN